MPEDSLLVTIGIDPESAAAFLSNFKKLTEEAGVGNPILIEFNLADEPVRRVGPALDDIRDKSGQAGLALNQALETAGNAAARLSAQFNAFASTLQGVLQRASDEAAGDEQAFARLGSTFGELTTEARAFVAEIAETNKQFSEGGIATAAARFQNIGKSVGFSNEEAFGFSKTVVTLAADLAKISGKGIDETLGALQQSLLRGGNAAAEFGIRLKSTDIQARAAALGLGDLGKNLTQEEEVQARLSIITERSASAHAEAAAASLTFGQATAALATQTNEAFGAIGQSVNAALKPYVEALTQGVIQVKAFAEAHPGLGQALIVITGLVAALAAAFSVLATVIGAAALQFGLLTAASTLGAAGFTSAATALTGLGGAVASLSTFFATAAASAAGFAVALAPFLAAAAIGAGIGILIDKAFGISEAFGKAAAESKRLSIEQERLARVGKTVVDNIDLTTEALSRLSKTVVENGTSFKVAQLDANIYAKELLDLGKAEGVGAALLDQFNRLLAEGLTPFQARAQALSEETRLLALAEKGTERSTEQEAEYIKLKNKATESTLAKVAALEKEVVAEEAEIKVSKEVQKARNESLKAVMDSETAVEDARVKATKSLNDDIALLIKRNSIALSKSPDSETTSNIGRKFAADLTALQEEGVRQVAEEQKKADKERDEAIKKSSDTVLEATAQLKAAREAATDPIKAELILLDARTEKALKEAKSQEERNNIELEFDAKEAEIFVKAEQKKAEATKKAVEAEVTAEDALARSRAEATASLEDDIALINKQRDAKLALAKTEKERAAIVKASIAEETKLVEETGRKRKAAADADRKEAQGKLGDFAKQQQQQADIAGGKGASVAVQQTADTLKEQAKNIRDEKDLQTFKKAADQSFAQNAKARQKAEIDAQNEVVAAQDALKAANRAADPVARKAAKQQLADALANQQTIQQANAAALAEEEKQRKEVNAAAAAELETQQKKAAEAAVQAGAEQAAVGGKTPVDAAAAQVATDAATQGEIAGEVATQVSALTTVIDSLSGALTVGLEAIAGQVEAFTTTANTLLEAAAILPNVANAMTALSDAQTALGESLSSFGQTVVDKFTEASETFEAVSATLDEHTAQLEGIDVGGDLRRQADDTLG